MLQVISTSTFLIIKFAKKYSNFYIYENGMITIINQRTRVSNKTATAIDHILTNSYTEIIFKTAMLKCDASNHFLFALSYHHIQRLEKFLKIQLAKINVTIRIFLKGLLLII